MSQTAPGPEGPALRRWLRPETADNGLGGAFLAMVTLLAALLRLFRLGRQPLWIDEFLTWQQARPGLDFWEQMFDTTQGPLYVAVIWPLVRQGAGEFLLRLPAMAAGVVTVPLIGLLASRLCGVRAGRLAALLAALGPFHIWYSQEARGYAFLMFFSVASTLVLLDLIRRGPRPAPAILFALLTAGGVWSNLSALFLWAGQGLAVLLWARPRDGRSWLWWTVAFGGGLLAVAPWILKAAGIVAVDRLAPAAETGVQLRGETTFSPLAYPFTIFSFLFGSSLGPSLSELHGPDRMSLLRSHWPLYGTTGLLAILGLGAALVRLRGKQWLLPLLCVVPLAAVTVLALRNVKTFNPRYVAVIYPCVLVLMAYGLHVLPRRLGSVAAVLLLALGLASLGGHYFSDRYAKEDLRAAAGYVDASVAADWPVMVPACGEVFNWYRDDPAGLLTWWGEADLRTAAAVRDVFRRKTVGLDGCWIVLARTWSLDPEDHLPSILAAEGAILEREVFTGVRLYRWRRAPREGEHDVQG